MKQKDARALMIREWNRWLQTQSIKPDDATGRDALKFFFELQDKRSPLMGFQTRGRDKWEVVHAWLIRERHFPDQEQIRDRPALRLDGEADTGFPSTPKLERDDDAS
jgi:nuclear transport factor 2 (NTF2) superfamily protein